jgi:hypothetical protein
MRTRGSHWPLALAIVLVGPLVLVASRAPAAVITIVNQDGSNEGFNDLTAVAPVGGNSGTTLGEQRVIVFETAAAIWGQVLASNVEIRVEAQFDALTCNPFSAVLGGAAALVVARDFPNAPIAQTWYPVALANALEGSDQSPSANDITATFNSRIDNSNGCLRNTNWYLGLDHQNGSDIDLLAVVLHELGHGLGFASFVNESTGAEFQGIPDVFGVFSLDLDAGLHWDEMATDTQRQSSAVNTADLVWDGPSVTDAAAGLLSSGTNGGFVRLYAPSPVEPGSSVSHYDTAASPNLLMEPAITNSLGSDLDLSDELMEDIGWQLVRCNDGIDNDGDGFCDAGGPCTDGSTPGDPGCASATDLDERAPGLPCDDGQDNDADGRTDFDPATLASPGDASSDPAGQGDPVCQSPSFAREQSQCQDGIDNDLDGKMDYDAGRSVNGLAHSGGRDPQCVGTPHADRELRARRCGIGFELALLLPTLILLRRRRLS